MPRIALSRLVLPALVALLLAFPAEGGEQSYRSGPEDMRIDIISPDGRPASGLILVLHTSSGHTDADDAYARKLVAQGYAVAMPHFLAAYGISPKQRRRTWSVFRKKLFADFSRIAAEVSGKLAIDRARVFAVGFSNGGYWAAYLAGKSVVRKGVAYYAAVTEAGNDREVDNLGTALSGQGGTVLFLHGTGDETVNVGAVRRLQKRVKGAATFVYYEGAGHRFERESSSANDAAATDAWKRTLDFLGH